MIDLYADVKRAAASVAREWPEVIEAEDVEQGVWVKLLESANYVDQVSAMSQSERNTALRRIGHQIASKERADYEVFHGQVYYGTQDVREILERGALTSDRTRTDTERLDLEEGMVLLRERSEAYARTVYERYQLGESIEDRKELSRAVDALTKAMNNVNRSRRYAHDDGPGSREVVANRKAQWLTGGNLEEAYANGGGLVG